MLYYEGLSCPVCKKPFAENEDIVACPQCGLPHHRSCWMTVGHCYLAEKHGTEEQWSRNKAETETAPQRESAVDTTANICPHCHTRNIEFAEFCTHCGAALSPTEWHSQESPVKAITLLGSAALPKERVAVGTGAPSYLVHFGCCTASKD